MKHLITLLFIFSLTLNSCAQDTKVNTDNETSTYYFIRHAEKDRSDATNSDPNLIQKGILRAAKWSYVLESVDFDAIYSTEYNRTLQTAGPIAEKKNIEISTYDPRDMDFKAFIEATKGQKVLVVGHSNTTPMFVNELLEMKKYPDIEDDNNANLYIVTITSSGEVIDTLLLID